MNLEEIFRLTERNEKICEKIADELENFFSKISGMSVAVSFSGGLDSSILAFLSSKYCDPVLYSVGLPGSRDLENSRRSAERLEEALGRKIIRKELTLNEEKVVKALKFMARLGMEDTIVASFEVPLFVVLSECEEKKVISGQGADELFLGYFKYLRDPSLWEGDFRRLIHLVLPFEDKMAEKLGKEILRPYLTDKIIEMAFNLRPEERISGGIRKLILRRVGAILGVPEEILLREKKAAQYGSGSYKIIRKICQRRGIEVRDIMKVLRNEGF